MIRLIRVSKNEERDSDLIDRLSRQRPKTLKEKLYERTDMRELQSRH